MGNIFRHLHLYNHQSAESINVDVMQVCEQPPTQSLHCLHETYQAVVDPHALLHDHACLHRIDKANHIMICMSSESWLLLLSF